MPGAPSEPKEKDNLRHCFTVVYGAGIMLAFALIVLGAATMLRTYLIWDDAYMFVRYADNLIQGRGLVWNPDGSPTYGLTSLLYLGVLVPMRLIFPNNPTIAVSGSSFVGGLAFIAILSVFLHHCYHGKTMFGKVVILLVLVSLARAREDLSIHLMGGMDTTFVLGYLTLYLFALTWHEASASWRSAVMAGGLGGLAFWVRPDLCLYSFIAPAAMTVWARDRSTRRQALVIGAISAALTLTLVSISYWRLGSPLPLSFYCKGLTMYGPEFQERYRYVGLQQLLLFLGHYWHFFLAVVLGLAIDRKSWFTRGQGMRTGLLIATAIFLLYYSLLVTQIMYYGERFYFPVLPAVILLAVHSLHRLAGHLERAKLKVFEVSGAVWLCLMIIVVSSLLEPAGECYFIFINEEIQFHNLREEPKLNAAWFGLNEISVLSDDLVIAATEIGHVAAMNPNKTIVDLSGLNDTEIAHHGFDPEAMFRKYNPDFIYMPHPHYTLMNEKLEASPTFKRRYHFISRDIIKKDWGVAVRRDSKYALQMEEIIINGLAPPRRPKESR